MEQSSPHTIMTSCVFTELTEICKSASQKSVLVSIIHVGYLFCESPVLWKISVIRWHYHWTIFVSKKLEQDLKPKEIKLPIIKQQCIVYTFSCDLYTLMQIMLGIQPDISTNALLNIRTWLSGNSLQKLMGN